MNIATNRSAFQPERLQSASDRPGRDPLLLVVPVDPAGRFSAIEQVVILLAAHPREQPEPHGLIARLIRRLRHGAAVAPLACPRLEALRHVAAALHARCNRQIGSAEAIFLEAGWHAEDIAAVRSLIAGRGKDPPPRHIPRP